MSFWDDIKYGLLGFKPPEQELHPVNTDAVNAATGGNILSKELAELVLFRNEDKYNEQIRVTAKNAGVPYSIAKGLIALESAFNEKSYRYEPHINDASYGLAQILAGTARGMGYTGPNEGLYDVATNLSYGFRYLATVNSKYPNWSDTLAAYNMGWPRPATQTTPLIEKIYGTPTESWKYANQPYVDRVMAYALFYQAKDIDRKYSTAKTIFDDIKSKNTAAAVTHGVVITAILAAVAVLLLKNKM